jgi:hypothetical protein
MKRIILFVVAIFCAAVSFSQVSLGLKGSLNIANQSLHAAQGGMSGSASGSSIPSFQIGGFADIHAGNNFSFTPELLLSGEGTNLAGSDPNSGEAATLKFRLYYLRIPLNLLYEANVRGGAKFFIGGGPDIGFGLFGKTSLGFQSQNSFEDSLFKRFDFGLNFISGVELQSGVRFSINYNLGLSSIIGDTFSSLIGSTDGVDLKWYNRVISFSVGYVLNKGKKDQ